MLQNLAIISLVATILLNGYISRIDDVNSRENTIFRTYPRRVLSYFVASIGIPIYLASLVPTEFANNPLILLVYLLIFGFFALLATGFAKETEMELRKSASNLSRFLEKNSSPCAQELMNFISDSKGSELSNPSDIPSIFLSGSIMTLLELAVEKGISTNCIDEILLKSFFDKFEAKSSGKFGKKRYSRKEYAQYIESKQILLNRDDEIDSIFQESFAKWSLATNST